MEEKEFLKSQLMPIIGSSSVDTVVEYLSSFENIDSGETRDDMAIFLESSFGFHEEFSAIIEKFIQMRILSLRRKENVDVSRSSSHKKQMFSREDSLNEGKQNYVKDMSKFFSLKHSRDDNACNCMATCHDFFVSCVNCGRLHCAKERENNVRNCIFCGAPLCLDTTSCAAQSSHLLGNVDNEACERAYNLKDKLLLFDKECASRTKVFDAQGDYYETSTWLSEEEKELRDEKERIRREVMRRRPKNKLAISFDIAGRKTVQYIEDYADTIGLNAMAPEDKTSFDGFSNPESNLEISSSTGSITNESAQHRDYGLENTGLLIDSSRDNLSKAASLYYSLRERLVSSKSQCIAP